MEKTANKSKTGRAGREEGETTLSLTALETEIMQVVWEKGNVSAGEVREALLERRPLAHTTILTVLEKLRRKKAVRVVPSTSRSKRFRAVVDKDTIACSLLDKLRNRFFGGSTVSLVAHLVNEQEIEESELDELRRLFEQNG
jgi:predicted transcriptional regulator